MQTAAAQPERIAVTNSELLGDQRVLGEMFQMDRITNIKARYGFATPVAIGVQPSLRKARSEADALAKVGKLYQELYAQDVRTWIEPLPEPEDCA